MVTLAPAHPVYAKHEDEHQRDTQAESEASIYFEHYLPNLRCLLADTAKHALRNSAEREVQNALRDLFVAGWNAAREEQNR